MDIVEILKQDYQRFPYHQTYDIYHSEVRFQDPLTSFSGLKRYQSMINFMETWFKDLQMELHSIERDQEQIQTQWTLRWISPLPWKPKISISGRSELTLNSQEQIISHLDYWNYSPLHVVKQHFFANGNSYKTM